MAAPTIAALLDYEGNYEDALQTYLAAQITGTQVLTPRTLATSQPKLTTPRITIAVQVTGTDMLHDSLRTTDGASYRDRKFGNVTIGAAIRRDASGQGIGPMRGKLRKAMLEATAALTEVNLPYYQTIALVEQSSAIGSDPENEEITVQMVWSLDFQIKPDQWAAT